MSEPTKEELAKEELKRKLLQGLLDSMNDPEDDVVKILCMLYGESGVGKTVLAMQIAQAVCPPGKQVLHIDFARGFDVLRNPRWQHLAKNARRMQYRGLSQIEALAAALTAANPPEPFDKVGVVILDESSSMADNDLLTVVKARASKDPTKDPDEPKQPDMNATTQRVKRAMSALHAAPVHVIHLAHIRKDKDNLNIEVVGPSYMPKLSSKLREEMLVVGNVQADIVEVSDGPNEYRRFVQIQPSRRVIAKCRIDGMPERPSFDEFITGVSQFTQGQRSKTEVDSLISDLETEDENNTESLPFPGIEVN